MAKSSKEARAARDDLESMVNSIEDARSAGRRDGVQASLRFLSSLRDKCARDDHEKLMSRAISALSEEMKRRRWIDG